MAEGDSVARGRKGWLSNPLEITLCVVLAAIVLVTFLQVLFRYVIQTSLGWSEELARFLFMWFAALGAGYAFKTKSHFALTFLVGRLGPSSRKGMGTLVVMVVSAFLLVFTYQAVVYVVSVRNQIAPSLRISMAIPYSSAAVGGALMLYFVVRNWWTDFRRPMDPETNPRGS